MGNVEIKQKNWENLSISNDFLFGKVMQNPELCRELLQRIPMLKNWKKLCRKQRKTGNGGMSI